jgi:hypothetical protein
MAFSLNILKTLGLGLPFWAKGVMVPTSIKPNPRAPRESIKSPFLSRPAATPSLLAKSIPNKDIFCSLGFGKNKFMSFKECRILRELRAIL